MRIAYLAAGAAGMYCGSCLHDNTLAAAMLDLGEDVILVPIYTPLRTDEENVSQPRVFFGGINAYLQQNFSLFRRTPRWLDDWLDQPWLLNLIAGRGASVDASKLGPMTVSMLRGEAGNQRKELSKLVDWLVDEVKPDVVHLSNSMMIGLARMIAERCGPPVVCSLSGEDIFLEKLVEPHYSEARKVLRERTVDVNAFVALNNYFADYMAEYLSSSREKIHVIPHGLNLEGHGVAAGKQTGSPRRIGFLSRICHDKGLHLLVEAGERLTAMAGVPSFEICAAGYLGAGDRNYLREIFGRVERGPLAGKFTYLGEPDRAGKIAFLQSLDVLCIPAPYRESKGLPLLEGWANGIPAVVPHHGTYPELIVSTGGGLLHAPLDSASVAERLAELLRDPDRAAKMGQAGQRAVRERFHARAMAEQTLKLYEAVRS